MIDAVLSYHMNPATCGVAKFNHELAKRLGVPVLPLENSLQPAHALFSLKPSEMPVAMSILSRQPYSLLLHDRKMPETNWLITHAHRVWYADELGCPSTVNGDPSRGTYRVLTFGMSHKLLLPHFEQLQQQLEREHPDYTIELSTAVHEGNPWDEALTRSIDAIRGIFGARLRVLGFLGDDALARVLGEVDAVACFYSPALRANNTTYWAAVEAGKIIYTNRDEHSPREGDPPASWDKLVELIRA